MSNVPPDQDPQMEQPPMSPPPAATGYSADSGMVSAEEKSQAMLCWILTLFFGFIPGLIFYLTGTDKPFLKRQAALSLTLSIIGVVGYIASLILAFILIGFVTMAILGVWYLVVCIMGAIATNKGENFSPKFVDKMCYSMFKL